MFKSPKSVLNMYSDKVNSLKATTHGQNVIKPSFLFINVFQVDKQSYMILKRWLQCHWVPNSRPIVGYNF